MSYGVQIFDIGNNLFNDEGRVNWRVVGKVNITIPPDISFSTSINMASFDPLATRISINSVGQVAYSGLLLNNNKRSVPLRITYSGTTANIFSDVDANQNFNYFRSVPATVLILRQV